jgi:hypothetical protein
MIVFYADKAYDYAGIVATYEMMKHYFLSTTTQLITIKEMSKQNYHRIIIIK